MVVTFITSTPIRTVRMLIIFVSERYQNLLLGLACVASPTGGAQAVEFLSLCSVGWRRRRPLTHDLWHSLSDVFVKRINRTLDAVVTFHCLRELDCFVLHLQHATRTHKSQQALYVASFADNTLEGQSNSWFWESRADT